MKVSLLNLGCPKNQKDGEQALSCFVKHGFTYVQDPKNSEVIIVNTCGFIDDAKKESIAVILECAEIKKRTNKKTLIVMGCLSQLYPEELKKEILEADIIFGTGSADQAYEMYKAFKKDKEKSIYKVSPGFIAKDNSYVNILKESAYVPETFNYSSYVKVAEGCSNRCTYCVIPSIRGDAIYRRQEDVIDEIKKLCTNGVKEIVLIAQDLSSNSDYLKKLLNKISKIKNPQRPKWLRLMYCNPWGVDNELISLIKNEDFIVKYIDMPIQHISEGVLKRMGRKQTPASIMKKLDLLRSSGIAVRSTVMTGFPGEKASDFNKLKKLVEAGYFHWLGIFVYSAQEGTPSAKMSGQVPLEVAVRRRNELDTLQFDITNSINESYLGNTYEAILSGIENGEITARIFSQAPVIDGLVRLSGSAKCNSGLVKVIIEDNLGYDLKGSIVSR